MKNHYKAILIILAAAFTACVGTSCRTVQGVGQDVEHVGKHIEKSAEKSKR